MNGMDTKLSMHGATAISTRSVWINGTWHREIVFTGDDESRFTLTVYGAGKLDLRELPDEYVNVEDYNPRVERSDTPFEASPEGDSR